MASAKDLIVISGILLAVGLLIFIVNFAARTMVTQIVAIPQVNSSQAAVDAFNNIETSTNKFDYLFFGLFIGLVLTALITGWFVGGDPIFMVMYFLVAVLAVIASTIISNVWYDASNSSVFGVTLNYFPITNHILSNLPIYITVIAILGTVVMFSRPFLRRGI